VSAPDGFAAVDKAVGKLEHQLHKLKTKLQRRHQGGSRGRQVGSPPTEVVALATTITAAPPADADLDGEDAGPRIVKVKRHALKPMAPEEAVLQLDLVGHDFYFFTNADTGRSAVLYRRADGDLGLIDEAD
jgi:putative sigma-54 modulation protein